ncbi:unnamed protein product [Protopolystoma xenopodis]|uniref:Uncharacterized protein n=1 Tax=Protopolystoma xenopodis TaxID=117903 RepID=A0A3S5C0N8_9PLAT|nr:unnamed protein product [Protopolystoma xenopodis]
MSPYLAFANDSGLAVVDVVQRTCLLSLATSDLYGEPYISLFHLSFTF